jgi:hypothetical protein
MSNAAETIINFSDEFALYDTDQKIQIETQVSRPLNQTI